MFEAALSVGGLTLASAPLSGVSLIYWLMLTLFWPIDHSGSDYFTTLLFWHVFVSGRMINCDVLSFLGEVNVCGVSLTASVLFYFFLLRLCDDVWKLGCRWFYSNDIHPTEAAVTRTPPYWDHRYQSTGCISCLYLTQSPELRLVRGL